MSVNKKQKLDSTDFTSTEERQLTPLHLAAEEGNEEVARALLSKSNLFLNMKTMDGSTALHIATKGGFEKLVLFLLEHNADIESKDALGNTPLHVAVESNETFISNLLLDRGANVNAQNNFGKTSFHVAVHSKSRKIVNLLLDYNAEVNIKDSDGRTPIFSSISNQDVDMIKFLLRNGADVNIKSLDGFTPFLESCRPTEMYVDLILPFLDWKPDVNCRTNDGSTVLHLLAGGGDINNLKILLKHGTEVNARNNKGETPLHSVVTYELYNIAPILSLLRRGADINIEDSLGNIPAHYAEKRSTNRIIYEHSIKMKVAGLFVCDKNLEYGVHDLDISKLEEEISRMKDRKLNDTISLYDILIKQKTKLADGDKEDVVKVLRKHDYRRDFPLYSNLLTLSIRNLKKEIKRKRLQNEVHQFFSSSNYFSMLPFECVEEVLSYLRDDDLRRAVASERRSADSDSDSLTSEMSERESDDEYDTHSDNENVDSWTDSDSANEFDSDSEYSDQFDNNHQFDFDL